MFKNCAPFTDCIRGINNTDVDQAKSIDAVMPMCGLIEYSNSYSKTSGSLCQYYRDQPTLKDDGSIIIFFDNNNRDLFKFK